MQKLSNLVRISPDTNNPDILGITANSQMVEPGWLFFAVKGKLFDGHDYIDKAIASGAAAIIGEKKIDNLPVPYLAFENIRHQIALIASKFYTHKPSKIAVVTGTNGKTSTADFTRQLWKLDNYQAASIGTLGFISDVINLKLETDNTSPDPITLHELLGNARDAVVIEGSSIGLEQNRLDGLRVNAAGFTNFTRDHLDYHGSMEEYFRCKTLLFSDIMRGGVAVLNHDIPEYEELNKLCKNHRHDIISFGRNGDLKLLDIQPIHDGQHLKISVFGEKSEHTVPLVGSFQTYNILCALGLVIGCGMAKSVATSFIDELKSIPGRMEHAAEGVYVDYAHTPDALENALISLRPHTDGKLFVVFGCGGDRDKGKRPLMGKIANDLADVVFVTDDNPRTENPTQIRSDILAAAPKAFEMGDRSNAIKYAIDEMKKGDILLVAGKGHEKYQIYGTEKTYYDDVEVVRGLVG